MTKNYFILALALMLGAGASAKTLTPAEALARVANDNGARRVAAKAKAQPRLVYTADTEAGQPAVYVFSQKDSGFLILSADDVAYPLLGYSDNGTLDADNMAPAMKWWIEEYARQIQWAGERGAKPMAAAAPKEGRHDVPVMIKTRWDQGEPYNQLCPKVNTMRAYTGCVATSMSQIMYYFKYPEVGRGSISYSDDEGCGKRLSWNFEDHPFYWDDMLLTYRPGEYTPEQALAVAELMKSTGASVKMSYGADASGALSMNTASAFVKYFNYDPNIDYQVRSYMSSSRWNEMVYQNLANVGPVLYGGASLLGGGHSFIVDGYQAETGLFHFNWGWSEMSDGYYSLDALNPSSLGAGGGDGGGYNFTQDAVFGIQPPTGKPAETLPLKLSQQGNLGGEITGSSLKIDLVEDAQASWINYTPYDFDATLGVTIQEKGKLTGDTTVIAVTSNLNVPVGYGIYPSAIQPIDLGKLGLADGEYTVTMLSLVTSKEGQTWQPVQTNYGYSNSFTLSKKGDVYDMTTVPGCFYTVLDVSLEYEIYYGCLVKMHYKLANNNDVEISRGIAPIMYNTDLQPAFIGQSKMISLLPGEVVEGDIVTELFSMSQSMGNISKDTKFYLTLFDETSYRMMPDQVFLSVIMHPNPGLPSISVNPPLNIENADYNVKDKIFEVTDPANMQIYAALHLDGGFLAYPVYAVVLDEPDTTGEAMVIDYFGGNVFMDDPEVPYEFIQTYNFKAGVPGNTYYLTLALSIGGGLYPINQENRIIAFKVMNYSGIEGVEADNAPVEYFNLQGIAVDYDSAPAGVYIRRQGDETVKVMKK